MFLNVILLLEFLVDLSNCCFFKKKTYLLFNPVLFITQFVLLFPVNKVPAEVYNLESAQLTVTN